MMKYWLKASFACGKCLKGSRGSLGGYLKLSKDGDLIRCPKCGTWQRYEGMLPIAILGLGPRGHE